MAAYRLGWPCSKVLHKTSCWWGWRELRWWEICPKGYKEITKGTLNYAPWWQQNFSAWQTQSRLFHLLCCDCKWQKTNFRVLYSDNEARNFSNRILWTTVRILHMVQHSWSELSRNNNYMKISHHKHTPFCLFWSSFSPATGVHTEGSWNQCPNQLGWMMNRIDEPKT